MPDRLVSYADICCPCDRLRCIRGLEQPECQGCEWNKKGGVMPQGKLNRYTCQTCGCSIVTKDVDEGVTPFMIGCRATKGCAGVMHSDFYRVFGEPPHEFVWRRPTKSEQKRLNPTVRDHVKRGGLLIYPV